MVLDKLPVPGCPAYLDYSKAVRQGPLRLQYVRDGVVWTFFLYSIYVTTRFRLKYCLKGPLNPNNQLFLVMFNIFTLKLIFS